ncbi:Uncharacterized protein APZ42_033224 [Daphnia magna]|uniref:Secreted protein n=1 Tax=Daphnia magna TaxID=35525 RepID=A0A164L8L8_9CRUS|nr:Uncharacterized protein APZ42_033224 [Daphnia magna]
MCAVQLCLLCRVSVPSIIVCHFCEHLKMIKHLSSLCKRGGKKTIDPWTHVCAELFTESLVSGVHIIAVSHRPWQLVRWRH